MSRHKCLHLNAIRTLNNVYILGYASLVVIAVICEVNCKSAEGIKANSSILV